MPDNILFATPPVPSFAEWDAAYLKNRTPTPDRVVCVDSSALLNSDALGLDENAPLLPRSPARVSSPTVSPRYVLSDE